MFHLPIESPEIILGKNLEYLQILSGAEGNHHELVGYMVGACYSNSGRIDGSGGNFDIGLFCSSVFPAFPTWLRSFVSLVTVF